MNECSSSVGSEEVKVSKCSLMKNGTDNSNEAVPKSDLLNGDLAKTSENGSEISNTSGQGDADVEIKEIANVTKESEVADSGKPNNLSKTEEKVSAEASEPKSEVSNSSDSVIEECKSKFLNSTVPDGATKTEDNAVTTEITASKSDVLNPSDSAPIEKTEVMESASKSEVLNSSESVAQTENKTEATENGCKSEVSNLSAENVTKLEVSNSSSDSAPRTEDESKSEISDSTTCDNVAKAENVATAEASEKKVEISNSFQSECESKMAVDGTVTKSESEPIVSNSEQTDGGTTCTKGTAETDATNVSEMFTDDLISELKENLSENTDAVDANKRDGDAEDLIACENGVRDSEKTEAVQLFQQGKRNLLIKDFESAVETLGNACRKFISVYGQFAVECGEAHMIYGHALLELWRHEEENKKDEDVEESAEPLKSGVAETIEEEMENVDDSAVNEDESETGAVDDSKAESREATAENGKADAAENGKADAAENGKADAAENGKADAAENGKADASENGEADAAENGVSEAAVTNDESMNVDEDGNAAGSNEENKTVDEETVDETVAEETVDETVGEETIDETVDEADDDADSEDLDNLQLAWEVFEIAKRIYAESKDDVNLAKVYTKLSEISIASGNHDVAIEDLKRGLDLLNKLPTADARQIADCHFQLYLAHSAKFSFDLAEVELRKAKSTLEDKLNSLQSKIDDLDKEKDAAEFDEISSEIEEFKKLTRDMNQKIAEINIEKREVMTTIKKTLLDKVESPKLASSKPEVAVSSTIHFSPAKLSNAPVNSINHLVRKKPKMQVDDEENVNSKAADANGEAAESKKADSVSITDASASSELSCKRKAEDDEHVEQGAKKICVSQD